MIPFINAFLSYAMMWLVSAAVMAAGIFFGIRHRKKKDAQAAIEAAAAAETAAAAPKGKKSNK
jgi:predicted negative regulator of RcsB-dependent stress response